MGNMSDNGWAKLPASNEDIGSVNSREEQDSSTKEPLVDNLELFADTALRTPKSDEEDFTNPATSPPDTDHQQLSVQAKKAPDSDSEEDSDYDRKPAARPKLEHQSDDTESEEHRKPAARPMHDRSTMPSYDIESDDDRKQPAELTMNHPLNDAIDAELFDRDSPGAKRLRRSQDNQARTPSRTPSHGSLARAPEQDYDTTFNMNPLSPSEHAYQVGYSYQYNQNGYEYYDTSHLGQYVQQSHPPYPPHPYYQQQQQQHNQSYLMQQPTSQMPYAHAAAAHPRHHDHAQHHDQTQYHGYMQHHEHAQPQVEQEATATSSGEHSAQFNPGPSLEELENARTARARSALQTWYQRLEDLYRYRMQNGHCNVPQKYPPNEKLGIWVNKQRMEKKAFDERADRTSMTQRKIDALNSIGFTWAKRKGDVSWNEKFRALQEYRSVHGEVPTKYPANPALGRWVSTQRSNYKDFINGDRTARMTAEKKAMLESIGFKWKMMNNGN